MATRTFVVRTTDRAWIARNGGVVDSDGRVGIQVPADRVSEHTFARVAMLRTKLTDQPRDFLNPWAACPVPLLRAWEADVTSE